jgi:hypothetical protein
MVCLAELIDRTVLELSAPSTLKVEAKESRNLLVLLLWLSMQTTVHVRDDDIIHIQYCSVCVR